MRARRHKAKLAHQRIKALRRGKLLGHLSVDLDAFLPANVWG